MFRFKSGVTYARRPFKEFATWLLTSREYTNYTYDLEPINRRYLAVFVAHVTGITYQDALRYMDELDHDQVLRGHLRSAIQSSRQGRFADPEVRYGRRLGWYAIVRAVKPRVVVETGVEKGLGSCVLTAALKRNEQDGQGGHYYGTDINPEAGYLLQGPYAAYGTILYGDSIASLEGLEETIDIFINDSDHSIEYEAREYETVREKLGEKALLIGDNAHVSDKLLMFAEQTNRRFLFFKEQPSRHWYPGGGLGVAFDDRDP